MAKEKVITSKHKIKLTMCGWKKPGQKLPLVMTGDENGVHTGFVLGGTIDIEKGELYDILQHEKEDDMIPIFKLELL